MINLFQPNINEASLVQLKEVFESCWLGRGKKVKEFELHLSNYLGIDSTFLSTNSCCTETIFNSVHLLNLTNNDLVVIPTNSFPAIGSSVLESGAKLLIVDIDEFGNIDLSKIPDKVYNKAKLFFITHYGGIPVDIIQLKKLINTNTKVFEDCACALGTTINNQSIGITSDLACWSMDAMKLITTGEGGFFTSSNLSFLDDLKRYNYLGLPLNEKSGLEKSSNNSEWWLYDLESTGRRSVFCDFNAAIGLPELFNINQYLTRKREFRKIYEEFFDEIGLNYIKQNKLNVEYSNYFMTVQTPLRNELAIFLKNNGIYSSLRYSPLHKMNIFKDFSSLNMEGAELFFSQSLNIPIHHNLSADNVFYICESIKKFFAS